MIRSMLSIAKRLKDLREAAHLSQAELALRAHLRQATISDIENGKSERIGLDTIAALADALNVQPAELFQPSKRRR
jgi:transcriptional regulator with XRE-family HTH domain